MKVRETVLSSLFQIGLTAQAHCAYTAYTTNASDGDSGYQYWGSFGSGAIGGSGGTTAATYYNYSSPSFYTRLTIVLEFSTQHLLGLTPTSGLLKVYFQSANNVQINYAGQGDGAVTYPEGTGTTILSGYSQSNPGWALFDISVQAADAFAKNYDWMKFTINYTGQNDGSATVYTSESSFAPNLSLVPEPSALHLLALGGIAMILRRRR